MTLIDPDIQQVYNTLKQCQQTNIYGAVSGVFVTNTAAATGHAPIEKGHTVRKHRSRESVRLGDALITGRETRRLS